MPAQAPYRLMRATLFGVVCTALAVLSHVTAAHTGVPLPGIGVGGLLVMGVAWVLAGHERSPLTILGGLLGGQFALHALFSAVQPGNSHEHAQAAAGQLAQAQAGLSMTLAHLTAAAVSAWWLWRGERLAWSLARRLAAVAALSLWPVTVPLDGVPHVGPVRVVVRAVAAVRPVSALLRHCVILRGPPARSAFASI